MTGAGPATSPATKAAVGDLLGRLRQTDGRHRGRSTPTRYHLVSADGRSVLVRVSMSGDPMTAADRVQPILDAVAATRAAHPSVTIDEFGDGSANQWFNDTIGQDFQRAEWTAVPLALGILLVAFGALLAAILPVGLALTSFLAANGLLALVSHRLALDSSTSSVMLLIGLAVGVDYSHVLPAARARGAHPWSRPRDLAADRGRDLRPVGAGLGPHCRGGDVGHVLVGDADLRGLRRGGDPGRAGRGDRLGDGAAGPALPARRQGRARQGPGPGPDAASQRRQQGLGRRPRPGPQASWGVGARRRGVPPGAGDPAGRHPHRAAGPRQAAAGRRQHHAELPPDRRRLPGRVDPGARWW